MYVDYGNEEKVRIEDLRPANESIVTPLLAQAIPCRLNGCEGEASDTNLVDRYDIQTDQFSCLNQYYACL